MSDTQWKANPDGENPETVAVGIIEQINAAFIDQGVRFVIQVGDLADKETDSPNGNSSNRTMDTRAAAAQALYDAGIGFFPVRGNHEGSATAAVELPVLFPQTSGSGPNVGKAGNFSSPSELLAGLSYSFDYQNARFVLVDQFTRPDGSNYLGSADNNTVDQLDWIGARLSSKGSDHHGFLFSHKNLMGANHVDMLFGSNPSANPDAQNFYFESLFTNGVRYHFGGHDHNHLRSLVTSPHGEFWVQNIITSSNSYKFYVPRIPSIDETYDLPAFGFLRETPLAQELFTIGYYLVTVDGPRVTVTHYASDNGCGGTLGAGLDCDLTATPTLDFHERETFGYSLNGQEFVVEQGESYTVVTDEFRGTVAEILDGVNLSQQTIYDGRATAKDVNTGWTEACEVPGDLASNVLSLWGLTDLGADATDTYVLSMSYAGAPTHQGHGEFGIASQDLHGSWINAVDANVGGTKQFVHGPWREGYGLGTYGVDPRSKTAWAVINYDGEFAVARDIERSHGHRH